MTEIVMDAQHPTPIEGTEKCSQPGCIRPAPHDGMRHRYAPTKDLQPEPESQPEPVEAPVADERPFSGPVEDKPRNHAFTLIDDAKGLYVAWDTCAGCNHHITRCFCPNGPKTPEYIERWRQQQFPLAQPTMGEAKQIARDVAVDLGIRTEGQRFEEKDWSEGDAIDLADDSADIDRTATNVCGMCSELLYLLDTPYGKRAYTVKDDSNFCTADPAGIHSARSITQDDDVTDPDVATQPDVDDDVPVSRATDDPDYDEAEQQEVEQTVVETETPSDSIDPEVGF